MTCLQQQRITKQEYFVSHGRWKEGLDRCILTTQDIFALLAIYADALACACCQAVINARTDFGVLPCDCNCWFFCHNFTFIRNA